MTTTNIKVGDKVTCIDAGPNVYIVTGKEYIVEEVRPSGEVRVNNGERFTYPASRFELAAPKLKLPLAITRSTGTKVVLTASQKAGDVVMVYANSGEMMEYSEADVLSKLEDGIWTVNIPAYSAPSQSVEDAKVTLQAAKDALAAAEAALAAAEAANKPYLA